MLFTKARYNPCMALWRLESVGRTSVRTPSFCSILISGSTFIFNSPLVPFTVTTLLEPTVVVTPLGSVIGIFPILDIAVIFLLDGLINVTKHFATHVLGFGFFVGHQTFGGGHDRYTQTVHVTRHFVGTGVTAQTRTAHALEFAERGLLRFGVVFQSDFDGALRTFGVFKL